MYLTQIFPDFMEPAVVGVCFEDGETVKRSPVNPGCLVIAATRPVTFLMERAAIKNLPVEWVDAVEWKWNTDNTISVWDKVKRPG